MIKGLHKDEGQTFDAKLFLDPQANFKLKLKFEEKPELGVNCPKCGQDRLKFGKFGIYCDSDCKGEKKFKIQKTIASAKIDDEDLLKLLQGHKSKKTYSFIRNTQSLVDGGRLQ